MIGEYADIAGNIQGFLDNVARAEVRVLQQCERRRLCEWSTGANCHQVMFGLDDIAIAGDDEGALFIGNTEQCLEATQTPVGAPVLGEFDRCTRQVAVLLELAFEQFE